MDQHRIDNGNKKARFLQCQCDRSPVRTGMFHYNTDIASQFLSVDASFFKSLFVWWTSKGRSTISPPGLRTATVLLLLDTSIPTAVITAASIFLTSFNAGSAYAHYRFSLLCDTNVRQHFYLPITQPASIERCNGDGGEQFARTSVQLKQCFVLSAHLHCSLGLGICIAHWL